MFIARLYLFSFVYWSICVFGLGLVLTTILNKARPWLGDEPASRFLCAAALGILWKALQFAGLFALGVNFASRTVATAVLASDIALIVLGVWFVTIEEAAAALRRVFGGNAAISWIVGLLLGTWAFLQFPHVLDSGQLRWTQQLLFGEQGPQLQSMIGFSGLIVFHATFMKDIPLVTVAAALKPFLAVILVFVCQYVVAALDLRPRFLNAAVFFLLVLFSEFGLDGVVLLGKDSIYGVLFSVAFMATLCRRDAAERGTELGLFFAAGAATGIISVPYMIVAYGLWLLLATDAWKTLRPMVLFNAPVLPIVLAAFTRQHVLVAVFGYAVLGLLAWSMTSPAFLQRLSGRRVTDPLARLSALVRDWSRHLPLALVVLCYVLLPATLDFVVWYNPDGSAVTVRRPPLDGQTDLFRYLASYPVGASTIFLGVLAAVLICYTKAARARPGLIALSIMPFLILIGALAQVHAGTRLIPDFYIWDIIKDIPAWYGGPLFGLLALCLANLLADWVARDRMRDLLVLGASVAMAAGPIAQFQPARYLAPVSYTEAGGFQDVDMAVASALTWKHFRNQLVLIDPGTWISAPYFFNFQMFGARAAEYSPSLLTAKTARCCDRVGFIVRSSEVEAVRNFALAHKGTFVQLATLPSRGDRFVVVGFEAMSTPSMSAPGVADARATAVPASGMYDLEKVGTTEFRWMRASATVAVSATAEACVVLRLFIASQGAEPRLVSIAAPGRETVTVDVAGSSAARPAVARVPVNADVHTISLTAPTEERFPNDPRSIAYGLQLPILVHAAADCR